MLVPCAHGHRMLQKMNLCCGDCFLRDRAMDGTTMQLNDMMSICCDITVEPVSVELTVYDIVPTMCTCYRAIDTE